MTEPIFVTKAASPVPEFDHIGVTFQFSFEGGGGVWWRSTYGDPRFTFPLYNHDLAVLVESSGVAARKRVLVSDGLTHAELFNGGEVGALFIELNKAVGTKDKERVDAVLERLKGYVIQSYDEKSPVDRWAHMGVQLPSFGPNEFHQGRLRNLLTQKVRGRVLEAMCGFRSYINDASHITEVVAMDFCEPLLERHDHPNRTRILYDLERVVAGEQMDFFEKGSFQAVTVCFGVNYLSDPVPVLREFVRILSSPGTLLVVGGMDKGYEDLKRHDFDPVMCMEQMGEVGFSTRLSSLDLDQVGAYGTYYLMKGDK